MSESTKTDPQNESVKHVAPQESVEQDKQNRWFSELTKSLLEDPPAMVLAIFGIVGIMISILEPAGLLEANESRLTIGLLGLMAIAIGLERATKLRDIRTKVVEVRKDLSGDLKKVNTDLGAQLTVMQMRLDDYINGSCALQHIKGHDEAFKVAIRIVQNARTGIQRLTYSKTPDATDDFEKALQNTVIDKAVHYEWVLAVQTLEAQEHHNINAFITNCRDKWKPYADKRESRHFLVRDVDARIGFDILIVDKRFVLIYLNDFVSSQDKPELGGALLFEGEDIGTYFYYWFRSFVRTHATPFETWAGKHQEKTPARSDSTSGQAAAYANVP